MSNAAQLLAGLLGGIVITVLVVLFRIPRRPVDEPVPVAEPEPVDPVDTHFATAAALLQPDAPIETAEAIALLAAIAALRTPADMEVTR